jgi:hypothetical protein
VDQKAGWDLSLRQLDSKEVKEKAANVLKASAHKLYNVTSATFCLLGASGSFLKYLLLSRLRSEGSRFEANLGKTVGQTPCPK